MIAIHLPLDKQSFNSDYLIVVRNFQNRKQIFIAH
jgi:hypothetical protein